MNDLIQITQTQINGAEVNSVVEKYDYSKLNIANSNSDKDVQESISNLTISDMVA